ncbi:MAG TPA: YihY/virulence factor BrkB family protein [Rubricoccaceae bacterium]|jgi:membrane protein
MVSFATVKQLAVTTGKEVVDDDVPSLAAAIAYYTVFSLPPLLAVIVGVAGAVFGADAVQDALTGQVGSMIGPEAAGEIEGMIAASSDIGTGIGSKIAGLAALLFGATGAFGQLQKSMNRAWEVEEAAGGGIMATVMKRVLSFGMILTIAFLLLVSLALSAVLAAFGDAAASFVPGGLGDVALHALNIVVSLGVITVLFAAMFKWLPDADVAWRDVWVGAFATSVLFTLGKTAIGLYLGTADPGSAFGAAGSLALILIWIYYSALIVLVGVEFTQAWAELKGGGIDPESSTPESGTEAGKGADGKGSSGTPSVSGAAGPDGRPFSIEDAASGATRR